MIYVCMIIKVFIFFWDHYLLQIPSKTFFTDIFILEFEKVSIVLADFSGVMIFLMFIELMSDFTSYSDARVVRPILLLAGF